MARLLVAVSALLALLTTQNSVQASDVTDVTCKFSFYKRKCLPEASCSLQYRFGDITPSQACRVRADVVGQIPSQIHLAYAGETPGTGMTVSWTTYKKVDDAGVWVGDSANTLQQADVTVDVKSYYKDEKYELYSYHATISGLRPFTTYSYRVGSIAKEDLRSSVYTFTTARRTDDDSEFRVAVYGDLGVDENAMQTIKYVTEKLPGKVDFVFHVGDISYADNAGIPTVSSATEFTGFFYEETYNDFMTRMQPLTATTPYMVLPGNHESECHSAACMVSSEKKKQLSNYRAYNARFKMPSVESGGAQNMWYSFEHGPVHFTSISSETDFPNAPNNSHIPFNKIPYGGFGDQLAWLERDLQRADANRANVPWVVVMMHRAIYTRTMCDANGVPIGEAAPVQKAFEELFIKYNVDVVVSGHVHLYSRHFPVRRNKPILDGVSPDYRTYTNPKAPVYLISGAAGNSEGHKKYDATKSAKWNAVMDNQHYGISMLKVSRKALEWEFVGVDNGNVLDKFSIQRN
ncbi:hypothetical protein P43SY_001102 [Pythium insidiosum]|uniref:Purple acid phosphatase n=1 Tax=Pythium insidiosum TaxID=114742 RepID=A0AAD5LRK6_PYTIN|nr:hypothetical protein P43SY_001102 [Pythium insidiosum]